ncbi:MAG: hypothetical protein IPM29_20540 [Planctomycetes bacterium]|nr:hypothetical protein [Planctomycetota bacterium]
MARAQRARPARRIVPAVALVVAIAIVSALWPVAAAPRPASLPPGGPDPSVAGGVASPRDADVGVAATGGPRRAIARRVVLVDERGEAVAGAELSFARDDEVSRERTDVTGCAPEPTLDWSHVLVELAGQLPFVLTAANAQWPDGAEAPVVLRLPPPSLQAVARFTSAASSEPGELFVEAPTVDTADWPVALQRVVLLPERIGLRIDPDSGAVVARGLTDRRIALLVTGSLVFRQPDGTVARRCSLPNPSRGVLLEFAPAPRLTVWSSAETPELAGRPLRVRFDFFTSTGVTLPGRVVDSAVGEPAVHPFDPDCTRARIALRDASSDALLAMTEVALERRDGIVHVPVFEVRPPLRIVDLADAPIAGVRIVQDARLLATSRADGTAAPAISGGGGPVAFVRRGYDIVELAPPAVASAEHVCMPPATGVRLRVTGRPTAVPADQLCVTLRGSFPAVLMDAPSLVGGELGLDWRGGESSGDHPDTVRFTLGGDDAVVRSVFGTVADGGAAVLVEIEHASGDGLFGAEVRLAQGADTAVACPLGGAFAVRCGQVVDADGGAPLVGATVAIAGGVDDEAGVATDGEGRFALVAPREAWLVARAPGRVTRFLDALPADGRVALDRARALVVELTDRAGVRVGAAIRLTTADGQAFPGVERGPGIVAFDAVPDRPLRARVERDGAVREFDVGLGARITLQW